MADLGTHFAIGDTLTIPFQTRSSTGALADADAVPAYRIYEEGGTTAVTSGSGAKRDDANTTGYYEASVSLLAATGFEVGKSYTIYKTATIGGVAVGSLDTFAITNAGAGTFNAISGWFTVTDVENVIAAAGLELRASVDDDYIQARINAVITEIARRTRRQFVADAVDVTRYFDGSGTGLMIVDDMVSLTSVSVLGWSSDAAVWAVGDVYLANDDEFPRNRLLIRQGSFPAAGGWYLNHFPAGRRNIKVIGMFGYASSIPYDIWAYGAEEVAFRLGQEGMFSSQGRLVSWSEESVSEKYDGSGEALHWHKHFEGLFSEKSGYVRPAVRVWSAAKRKMV